jgi:lipid-A-disaccharide synthase
MEKIKIFIIAGEPSGDVLGGKLMAEIKQQAAGKKVVEFVGVGGSRMTEQGLNSIFPIEELSVMGFAEVVPHIPKLLKRIKQTADEIVKSQANMVITIDSPDFCFRVIKKIAQENKAHKIKKVHFIAPTVWAYREKRAEKIAKLYDLLLAILPFEPPYFEKHGLETLFIGHPITENNWEITENLREKYQIQKDAIVLCAMAGSRVGEVKRILPEIIGAANILAEQHPDLVVLLPTIKKTETLITASLGLFKSRTIILKEEEKYPAFKAANLAIAKSGTNNLEIAIAQTPMITIYKISPLTHFFIKGLIKVKFANLINLILNKELIPELIQDNCTAAKIAATAKNLLDNKELMAKQTSESQKILKILGLNSKITPSAKAAQKILSYF